MKFAFALFAGSALAPILAHAQPIDGLYVGAGGGVNFLQNETIKGFAGTTTLRGSNPRFDTGWNALGSLGYGFGNGFRVEVEGNVRQNEVRGVKGVSGPAKGREQKYGAMLNALYDFGPTPFGVDFFVPNPYLGVGAGYSINQWHHVRAGDPTTGQLLVNNSRDGFAYQAIAGVSFPVYSVAPGLAFTVEYRFFSEPQDRKYPAQLVSAAGVSGGRVKLADDLNHSINVGIRYAFNVPPPPAPLAPAPVSAAQDPTRTYLVFFDWDRADLTGRARQIIGDAAQNVGRVQYTRIEVDGHADKSGTAAYNQRLSLRRAQAVAGELTRDGVPQSAIDIQAFGDTRPLVPTAAGVREPQNRRVEIVIR